VNQKCRVEDRATKGRESSYGKGRGRKKVCANPHHGKDEGEVITLLASEEKKKPLGLNSSKNQKRKGGWTCLFYPRRKRKTTTRGKSANEVEFPRGSTEVLY